MIIAVTGGAGTIGSYLVPALVERGHTVRVLDCQHPAELGTGIAWRQVDLREPAATVKATTGADSVIHLAGNTWDAPLPEVYDRTLLPAWHVLEAARHNQIPRVVLASSHHTIGFTPTDQTIPSIDTAPVPDSVYGVGKVTLEALGSLYAYKHYLEVVALRLGSFRPAPSEPRHAATWLSPRDGVALFHAAATMPLPHPFVLVYGTSNNSVRWWPRDHWEMLGYHPHDSAADYVTGALADPWHGGGYATADHPQA